MTKESSKVSLLDDLLDYCKTLRVSEGQEEEVEEPFEQPEPEGGSLTDPDIKPLLPKHIILVKEVLSGSL